MAEKMDDLEFLLPSELLTDDDLLTDFTCGFGLSSDLSSPVESVTGTTETNSDEDDFITELTRKLTHSSLHDSNKGLKLSGSPQSTLCGFKPGSNSGSQVCSPPENKDLLGWDLLYAAAEEVARMRMVEETASFYSTNSFAPTRKHNPTASGFYQNQTHTSANRLSYQQLQAVKFQQMKQQQMMKRESGYGLSMSGWPTLQQSQQQRTGSGLNSVFIGETGPVKERVGTGVFMPRRFGSTTPTETRIKQGCTTVMVPDRVVHALNGTFTTDYDDVLKQRNNVMMANQRRNMRAQQLVNQDFRLPQDWTY